jgi:hypothetical protein
MLLSLLMLFVQACAIVPIAKMMDSFGCVAKTPCGSLAGWFIYGTFVAVPLLVLAATAVLSTARRTKYFALNAAITWIAFSMIDLFALWEVTQLGE